MPKKEIMKNGRKWSLDTNKTQLSQKHNNHMCIGKLHYVAIPIIKVSGYFKITG